jgi:transposase
MPRKSPYEIALTAHEKKTLEAAARKYTSPYRNVVRSKIILLAAQDYDNDEIASRLDTPRQIVSKWRKRFYYDRLMGLQDQPRGGRPGSFSPRR